MGLLDQAKAALGSASGQQQQQAPADGQAPAAGASTGQQDALGKYPSSHR
jgi:hypothetical protein